MTLKRGRLAGKDHVRLQLTGARLREPASRPLHLWRRNPHPKLVMFDLDVQP
jgi:hypothetical protein